MSILSEILSTGHVDKELLDALDDAQKQLLFCQMRAEQVRKWQANEERLDREGAPKKTSKKGIKWLTGADGEVWVWVMGDHPLDKSIEEILEEEARREAHSRALRELSDSGDPEEALKAQLEQMRVGITVRFSSVKSCCGSALFWNQMFLAFFLSGLTSTMVSSFTTPQPQKAEFRGPPPPIPARPPELFAKSVQITPEPLNSSAPPWQGKQLGEEGFYRCFYIMLLLYFILLYYQSSFEIPQLFSSDRRAREAEEAMRRMAQKAREQHRQLIRTSTSILPALNDTKATSLREAIKNLPRPPKPKSRSAIVDWFKRDEWPRGTGQDPKTRMPAPWFHGIISRDQAEILLQDKPTGSFLVRVSERIWGYTVSYVVGNGTFKHFLVERIPEGYQFLGTNQVVHDQLFDLVSYHETAPITAKGGEILKWSVGQMFRPPDYHDIVPELAIPDMNRLVGRF
ncbi:unnamed protein product [Heligmosomoides polygyrus]|uniref:SH2 domain-containing protein n=1 Tax=Heligmosomoides polygyrus TaxID=6339 RepID=A0A183FJF3_HELPZ|nr:unnamed protein product [Heligmosomoides polygyrus]